MNHFTVYYRDFINQSAKQSIFIILFRISLYYFISGFTLLFHFGFHFIISFRVSLYYFISDFIFLFYSELHYIIPFRDSFLLFHFIPGITLLFPFIMGFHFIISSHFAFHFVTVYSAPLELLEKSKWAACSPACFFP